MLVTVENGHAVAIGGDPDHPVTAGFLCGKVSNYLERVYADDRLLHPLVREGAKGEGRFRRVSWDEALEHVGSSLSEIVARDGGEAVLPYSYLGTMGALQNNSISARFFNALGASELERTICAHAGIAGVLATTGPSPEVDPEEWPHARLIVAWGWNPLSTAPHLWRFILEARRRGARLVVVDPYRSRTARVADQHIQPVPGTDGALALGLMRAMVDAGLADDAWCRAYTSGYDELLERLAEYPVERCASICRLPSDTIERLGRDLATVQPSLVRLGVGAQRHLGAPIAYRTIACVPALAGSWRHRGGGLSYIPVATADALRSSALHRPDLKPGPTRSINMATLGQALTDRSLSPPVSALVVWNANPAAVAPDQEQVLDGLRRDDLFTVVLEQFLTDTATYADVVLPATTQLEHLDVLFSWGHHYLTMNEPAVAPLGEALPNTEIFRRLAAAVGLDDPCFAETDDQLVAELFQKSAVPGITLERLRSEGWAKVDLGQGPTPHASGAFRTPSGKLEFEAESLAAHGLDPLPFYDPPAEIADEQLAGRFPLCLLTPKTHLFLNSTFANGRRQGAAQPEPFIVINPSDADERGVTEGTPVRVFNDRGAFVVSARVSDDVRPGVVVSPMGWWNRTWRESRSCQATTSQRLTAIIPSPTFNDNRVEIELHSP